MIEGDVPRGRDMRAMCPGDPGMVVGDMPIDRCMLDGDMSRC